MTKTMTLTEARKTYNGKTVRAFGKHTGTVENVYRTGDGRLIFAVNYEASDPKVGGMAFMNEIEVQHTEIIGYTLSLEEILKHAAK